MDVGVYVPGNEFLSQPKHTFLITHFYPTFVEPVKMYAEFATSRLIDSLRASSS